MRKLSAVAETFVMNVALLSGLQVPSAFCNLALIFVVVINSEIHFYLMLSTLSTTDRHGSEIEVARLSTAPKGTVEN